MAEKKTRIGLIGPTGRMGMAIATNVASEAERRAEITATLGRGNAGELENQLGLVDVFLDVSSPAASEQYLRTLLAKNSHTPYVIGCTGWNDAQLEVVHAYSKQAAVVFAPNFSPGVNLFLGLIEQAAPMLERWGYDVSVHETHHTRKVDAPSGTAKAIVERLGNMKPQVHATRAGNIIGTHEVNFYGPSDIITLKHEALDRAIFARGAVFAAEWAASKKKSPGYYTMKQVVFGSD